MLDEPKAAPNFVYNFPPSEKYGRVSFCAFLERMQLLWDSEKEKLVKTANSVTLFIQDKVMNKWGLR